MRKLYDARHALQVYVLSIGKPAYKALKSTVNLSVKVLFLHSFQAE